MELFQALVFNDGNPHFSGFGTKTEARVSFVGLGHGRGDLPAGAGRGGQGAAPHLPRVGIQADLRGPALRLGLDHRLRPQPGRQEEVRRTQQGLQGLVRLGPSAQIPQVESKGQKINTIFS